MRIIISGLLLCLMGCQSDVGGDLDFQVFSQLTSENTGLDFENTLTFKKEFNVYTYRNFYNGGGVGVGDFNGDQLPDIYLTANMGPNKLYLNKGNLKFEDVTEKAGVAGQRFWSTGVTVADLSGDGLLDIYVCNSGDLAGDDKQNELFINQGDGTFLDKASEYGLADQGYSTHAVALDYDRDGDLDLYVLNNSYQAIGSFNLKKNVRNIRDSLGGDKLYRNDSGVFKDVSEAAGIFGSVIGFGLGITASDFNRDGWPDLFISNDFFERDYLYINQQDGTFKESLTSQIRSTSAASMGADASDINGDGFPDIFVTEMLPRDEGRLKTKTTFEGWDKYRYSVGNDYWHQYTRNVLQLNNGNNTFSEVGRLAGVEATDWSWGALFADFNLDGQKDLFVANGIARDLTDQDYLQFIAADETKRWITQGDTVDFRALIDFIPEEPVPNYLFKNEGDLTFSEVGKAWGMGEPSFSNGSAYVDLDLDGDYELVVNDINHPVRVFKNNAIENGKYSLLLSLKQPNSKNSFAIGTTLEVVHSSDRIEYFELFPNRGFQSSVGSDIVVSNSKEDPITRIDVTWPEGQQESFDVTELKGPRNLVRGEGSPSIAVKQANRIATTTTSLPWSHNEDSFIDFNRDFLTFHARSTAGPASAVADVDGDGLEDLFLGGAHNQSSVMAFGQKDGTWRIDSSMFEAHREAEDVIARFTDINNDGTPDLFVGTAGALLPDGNTLLNDRLYINLNGKLLLSDWVSDATQTGAIAIGDFDADDDDDVVIAARQSIGKYGQPVPASYYENSKAGLFKQPMHAASKAFRFLGLTTGLAVADVNSDGYDDLLAVGEWGRPRFFYGSKAGLVEKFPLPASVSQNGLWQSIQAADLDQDGKVDFILGNLGLNSRLNASKDAALHLYVGDFDENGTSDQIFAHTLADGSIRPLALKHDLVRQLPSFRKKFVKYADYRDKTVEDIFGLEVLSKTAHGIVNTLASAILWNDGDGKFSLEPLPNEAQLAPVFALKVYDQEDGTTRILLAGNLSTVKPEYGAYNASYGTTIKVDKARRIEIIPNRSTGFNVSGEIRGLHTVETSTGPQLLIARCNEPPLLLKYNPNDEE